MSKNLPTAVLDTPLDAVAAATEMYVCVGQPATRAAAIAASLCNAIARASGDFSKGAGTPSGRALTVAAKSGACTVAGTGDHVVLCTSSAIVLIDTVVAAKTYSVGDTIQIDTFTLTNVAVA